jgi:hypothetical protein
MNFASRLGGFIKPAQRFPFSTVGLLSRSLKYIKPVQRDGVRVITRPALIRSYATISSPNDAKSKQELPSMVTDEFKDGYPELKNIIGMTNTNDKGDEPRKMISSEASDEEVESFFKSLTPLEMGQLAKSLAKGTTMPNCPGCTMTYWFYTLCRWQTGNARGSRLLYHSEVAQWFDHSKKTSPITNL